MSTYHVTTKPDGEKRWWRPGEIPPSDHTNLRRATPEEAHIMNAILEQDAAGVMPDLELGRKIQELMAKTD